MDDGMEDVDTSLQQWSFGDATLTAVVEAETHGIPPQFFFPAATSDDVRACEWLGEYAAADGTVALRVQAFLLELPAVRVLVDPCVGNHKDRSLAFWHQQDWPWKDRFDATGVCTDEIDVVVHTHLHADHVGWDTHLDAGEWVPTFPNATYVYVDDELDYWRETEQRVTEDVYADSVAPVLERATAAVVGAGTDLGHGLQLVPTPGHTPGHVALEVTSAGETLLLLGDLMHHPVQFARPEWAEIGDYDASVARETRRAFVDEHARRGTVLAGAHFPAVPVGRARPDGGGWCFEPIAPRSA
jgi:glyoxylase-like metal-dependent hydrolase (beta-lactamase superfamily II)